MVNIPSFGMTLTRTLRRGETLLPLSSSFPLCFPPLHAFSSLPPLPPSLTQQCDIVLADNNQCDSHPTNGGLVRNGDGTATLTFEGTGPSVGNPITTFTCTAMDSDGTLESVPCKCYNIHLSGPSCHYHSYPT